MSKIVKDRKIEKQRDPQPGLVLDGGKSYKQLEAMTGISKSTLIRARRT